MSVRFGLWGLVAVVTASVVAAMLYSPPAPADDVAKRTTSSAAQARDNVRDFGAVGDGMHDDTAAIQKAVDSMTGAIRFSKGTYRLTQPVVIDLDRVGYTSLSGDGVAKSRKVGGQERRSDSDVSVGVRHPSLFVVNNVNGLERFAFEKTE